MPPRFHPDLPEYQGELFEMAFTPVVVEEAHDPNVQQDTPSQQNHKNNGLASSSATADDYTIQIIRNPDAGFHDVCQEAPPACAEMRKGEAINSRTQYPNSSSSTLVFMNNHEILPHSEDSKEGHSDPNSKKFAENCLQVWMHAQDQGPSSLGKRVLDFVSKSITPDRFLPGKLSNFDQIVIYNLGQKYWFPGTQRTLRRYLCHRANRLPGTIHGMSILHRCPLSCHIMNLHIRRDADFQNLYLLARHFKRMEFQKSEGAPVTVHDYLIILSACDRSMGKASRLIIQHWDPQETLFPEPVDI